MGSGVATVPDELPVFVVTETGDRTVVRFRDWAHVRKHLFYLEESFVAYAKREWTRIAAMNHSKVLVIDMANVDVMPTSLLAVLVSLSAGGLQIELLNPSEHLLELLEVTKLSRLFLGGDVESPPIRQATG
jgi:anti-anti-sigma regulatory factor